MANHNYHYGVDDFHAAIKAKEDQKKAEQQMQFARQMDNYSKPKPKRRRSPSPKKSPSLFTQIINWFKK